MSIATEITRIIEAKEDIVTSIKNKGVQVTAGSRINDLPGFIDQISGGGGAAKKPLAERLDPILYRMNRLMNGIHTTAGLRDWPGSLLSDEIRYGIDNNYKGMVSVYYTGLTASNAAITISTTPSQMGEYAYYRALSVGKSGAGVFSDNGSNVDNTYIFKVSFYYNNSIITHAATGSGRLFNTLTNAKVVGIYISALAEDSFEFKISPSAISQNLYKPEIIITDEKSTLTFKETKYTGNYLGDFCDYIEGNFKLETGVRMGATSGVFFNSISTVPRTWMLEKMPNIEMVDNNVWEYRFVPFSGVSSFGTIDVTDASDSNLNSLFPRSGNLPFALEYRDEAEVRFTGLIKKNINMTFNFSKASLLSAIDALDPLNPGTFTIGATNIAKLTSGELNTITTKGWTYA